MKGIIFSPAMVRALGEGRKTQTRRLLKPQPYDPWYPVEDGKLYVMDAYGDHHERPMPYAPGERLYVKEAYRVPLAFDEMSPSQIRAWFLDSDFYARRDLEVLYEAGGSRGEQHDDWGRYRHARFMPEWASRYHIEVVSVEPQQSRDISEEDVEAEGVIKRLADDGESQEWGVPGIGWSTCPFEAFALLLDSINGPEAWDQNLWVARMEFKLLEDRR